MNVSFVIRKGKVSESQATNRRNGNDITKARLHNYICNVAPKLAPVTQLS